jgi:hypothetical protein
VLLVDRGRVGLSEDRAYQRRDKRLRRLRPAGLQVADEVLRVRLSRAGAPAEVLDEMAALAKTLGAIP